MSIVQALDGSALCGAACKMSGADGERRGLLDQFHFYSRAECCSIDCRKLVSENSLYQGTTLVVPKGAFLDTARTLIRTVGSHDALQKFLVRFTAQP